MQFPDDVKVRPRELSVVTRIIGLGELRNCVLRCFFTTVFVETEKAKEDKDGKF